MPISYSQTVTFTATTSAVAAVDTFNNGVTTSPGTGWTISASIGAASPAADWVVIEYFLGTGIGLWACTDGLLVGAFTHANDATYPGTTLTAGAPSTIYLPPEIGSGVTLSNIQPTPNWNAQSGVLTYYNGFTNSSTAKPNSGPGNDQSEAVNFTCQSGFVGSHNANHWPYGPNFVALLPAATPTASGWITVTFQ